MKRYREPRDIWAVVTDSFRLARDVFPRVLVPLLLVALVPLVMGGAMLLLAGENPWAMPGTPWTMDVSAVQAGLSEDTGPLFAAAVMVLALAALLLLVWAYTIILARLDRMVRGTDSEGAGGRVLPLIGAGFVFALAAIAIVLLLMAASAWLGDGGRGVTVLLAFLLMLAAMVCGSLIGPAVVLERRGPLAAIGRSVRLVLPRFFRVLGVIFFYTMVYFVLAIVVSLIAWVILALVPLDSLRMLLNMVLGMVFQVVPMLLSAAMTCSLYYDVLARAEPGGEGAPFSFGGR